MPQKKGKKVAGGRPPGRRPAVLHFHILLVRVSGEGQLDALLSRAELRARILRRVDERTALFSLGALFAVRRRLESSKTPYHVETLPSLRLASCVGRPPESGA